MFTFMYQQTVPLHLFQQISGAVSIHRKEVAALGVADAAVFFYIRQNGFLGGNRRLNSLPILTAVWLSGSLNHELFNLLSVLRAFIAPDGFGDFALLELRGSCCVGGEKITDVVNKAQVFQLDDRTPLLIRACSMMFFNSRTLPGN